MKSIFDTYDVNQNGFIEYEELRELLIDLGLDAVFFDMSGVNVDGSEAPEEMPEQTAAFEEYCRAVWNQYDVNEDGYINFEEFIPIHTDLIDK
jgi:Ca2+-binding EF-hand superfamily protein